MLKDENFHLNDYKTPIYTCEIHTFTKKKFYYKQEYLLDMFKYGTKRPISEKTYIKRKKEGFKTQIKYIYNFPFEYRLKLNWIDEKIDLALLTKDKEWFNELVEEKHKLING